MKRGVLILPAALLCLAWLAPSIRAQEGKETETAIHNYGKRKVIHMHKAVKHSVAHVHHYVHHKGAKLRNWLDHH
jgi:hypothetical protein